MTIQSRAALKSVFENGDQPQGSDFADLIDSFVSLADTTAQALSSPITGSTVGVTKVSAATVSAQVVNGSAANFGSVSAQSITASAGVFTTKVESALVSAQRVVASAATFTAAISAATINAEVTASSAHIGVLVFTGATTAAASADSTYVRVRVGATQFWLRMFKT